PRRRVRRRRAARAILRPVRADAVPLGRVRDHRAAAARGLLGPRARSLAPRREDPDVTRRALFWALVGIQAVIPVGMLGLSNAHYAGADRVLLHVEPVDPLDPIRGEYVELRYTISNLGAPAGTTYVPLYETGGGVWTGYLPREDKPSSGTFIRG